MRYGCRVGARALHVHDGAGGLVADPPAEATQPPAEVDVLHVHEVALVPSPDRVERGAPEPHRRARHPVDVARPVRVGVELAVPTGEAVARARHVRSSACPTASSPSRCAPRRRVLRAVGVAERGPDRGEVGLGVEARQHRRRGARLHLEVGVARPRRPARVVARCRGSRPRAYPRLPARRHHAHVGERRARASATDPSVEPLSTTTTSGAPALVSASSDRTHASSRAARPRSSRPTAAQRGGVRRRRSRVSPRSGTSRGSTARRSRRAT